MGCVELELVVQEMHSQIPDLAEIMIRLLSLLAGLLLVPSTLRILV